MRCSQRTSLAISRSYTCSLQAEEAQARGQRTVLPSPRPSSAGPSSDGNADMEVDANSDDDLPPATQRGRGRGRGSRGMRQQSILLILLCRHCLSTYELCLPTHLTFTSWHITIHQKPLQVTVSFNSPQQSKQRGARSNSSRQPAPSSYAEQQDNCMCMCRCMCCS